MCGEKTACGLLWLPPWGSPPRVRGKAFLGVAKARARGITPACAGKRAPFQKMSTLGRDHPRVCGEKSGLFRSNAVGTGSPPRVRGKECCGVAFFFLSRITPAYAGKRLLPCCFWRLYRDHPRVCGEKALACSFCSGVRGSPPRMRGKVDLRLEVVRVLGITPAYAGKRF